MQFKPFFLQLCILTLLLSIALFFLHKLSLFHEYADLSVSGIFCFFILTLFIYFLGNRASNSPNKFLFTYMSLLIIFFKLAFSLMLILVYKKVFDPPTKYFIVPFILIYVCYTIFEVYFMDKLARIKK